MTSAAELARRVPRDGGSMLAPERREPRASGVNVGQWERIASMALGGTFVALGLKRGSLLGAAAAVAGGGLLYRATTGHCGLYQALGVTTADEHARGASRDAELVIGAITLGKPIEEVAHLWRDPQTMARIMNHFAEVSPAGEGRTRWKIHGPLGRTYEWETEVIEDRPGERQLWRSVEGAAIRNEGEVSFYRAPADRGTTIILRLRFDPPGGVIGMAAANMLSFIPKRLAEKTLYNFRSLALTGEIPTTENQPAARSDTR